MSNAIYDYARFLLNTAGLDWRVADLRLLAWGGPPTFIPNQRAVSDVVSMGLTTLIGTSQPVVGQNVLASGLAQTGPIVIPGIPIGMPVTHFTMVLWNAVTPPSSDLLLYIDDAVNLPFTPDGLDLVVQPDWLEGRGWFLP